MITKEEVKLFMMNFNITDIAADFSGGGDDGDIDNFDFLRDDVVIEYNWDYNEKTIEEYNWEFEY